MSQRPATFEEGSSVLLHNAGMRSTLPRRVVLETIAATPEHRSAEEILTERGIALPRSSVNNILTALARAGLIGRVDTLPGPIRFERDPSHHDHFWCTVCRRASNVPARRLVPPEAPGRVVATAITYLGECDGCDGTIDHRVQRKERN